MTKAIWMISAVAILAAQPVAAAELPPELAVQVHDGAVAARDCFRSGQETQHVFACAADVGGKGTTENPHSAFFAIGANFYLSSVFDAMYRTGIKLGHSQAEVAPFRKGALLEYDLWSHMTDLGHISDDDLGAALAVDAEHRDTAVAAVKQLRTELEQLKSEGPVD